MSDWATSEWWERARCRDEDPELFFPVGTSGPAVVQAELARAVCHRCPVMEECLQWALSTGQDAGVWGGLTADERRALRQCSVDSPSTARTGGGT